MTPKRLSFLEHPAAGTVVTNLCLESDGGVVDVLSNTLGVGEYARLRQNAVEIVLFGRPCPAISLDDLIVNKEAVGRRKDLLAARELRAIAEKRPGI